MGHVPPAPVVARPERVLRDAPTPEDGTHPMAKRDQQPATSRSRQRGKPVQVQAKTPWGLYGGITALTLVLLGVLGYAVANSGSGFRDPLERADSSIEGVKVAAANTLTRKHVETAVTYPVEPPDGGDHNPTPQVCRVYDAPVPNEHAVHSLEHGAVWITYLPSLPKAQVDTLRGIAEGQAYLLMSPDPEQDSPVVLTAWGRQLRVDSADDPRVEEFVDTYQDGPQTPEKGATCAVGNSTTTPLAAAPPAATPAATPAG